ncbi:VWA domain-containing protein, partial [Rhizobium hidalgonense]
MRRLPVYLLLDTSGSMHGEAIEAVKNGVQILLSTLRQDPYALETAYLSIISFDTTAKQLVPLTELAAFQAPEI